MVDELIPVRFFRKKKIITLVNNNSLSGFIDLYRLHIFKTTLGIAKGMVLTLYKCLLEVK